MHTTALALAGIAAEPVVDTRRNDLYVLRLLGDPCLRVPAVDVASVEAIPRDLVAALKRENSSGQLWTKSAGLSSQQIGGTARVSVAAFDGKGQTFDICINLRIVERSPELVVCKEGCMSAPHFWTQKRRHAWVIVEYRDLGWNLVRRRLEGFSAQVAQHEVDHLDGTLIVDGLSRQQRRQAERCVADFLGRA